MTVEILKLYIYRLAFRTFLVNVEKLASFEAKHVSNHVGWENLQFGVEISDVAVVKSS